MASPKCCMDSPKYYIENTYSDYTEELSSIGEKIHFDQGQMLNTLNERMDKLFFMLSGQTEFGVIDSMGNEKIIWFIGPGALFPLYSPLHKTFRLEVNSLYLRTVTEVNAIKISQLEFKKLLLKLPEIAVIMLDQYAELADVLLYEVILHSYSNVQAKICSFIYVYSNLLQAKGIEMTQEKLATAIGTSRLNLTRTLRMLREKGIIQTARKKIVVLDMERLRELCADEILC